MALIVEDGTGLNNADSYYKCSGRNQITLPSNSVPIEIKNSQVISASYYASGLNPRAASTGLRIQSEELTGVGKTSYFDSGGSSSTIEITEANDMIANLMCSNAESGLSIPTLRI